MTSKPITTLAFSTPRASAPARSWLTRIGAALIAAAAVSTYAAPAPTARADKSKKLPPQLAALGARAETAAAGLRSNNPAATKKANAELAALERELRAYAKANRLPVTTMTQAQPGGSVAAEQACPGQTVAPAPGSILSCTLTGSVVRNGKLVCTYSCVPLEKAKSADSGATPGAQGAAQTRTQPASVTAARPTPTPAVRKKANWISSGPRQTGSHMR